jgi:23S rRNA A2030 N6-methylase RlmJ
VFGQIVATNVLKALTTHTNNPMTFVDPRAGEGLNAVNREASYRLHLEDGADLLWQLEKESTTRLKRNPYFRDYVKILKHHNLGEDGYLKDELTHIPSGGELCRQFMRPHDRLILAEEDPNLFKQLETFYGSDPQITLANEAAPKAMLAHLPPRNPTGMVFYECGIEEDPADFIRFDEKTNEIWKIFLLP